MVINIYSYDVTYYFQGDDNIYKTRIHTLSSRLRQKELINDNKYISFINFSEVNILSIEKVYSYKYDLDKCCEYGLIRLIHESGLNQKGDRHYYVNKK